MKTSRTDIFALIWLICLTFLLYHNALSLWWIRDDPYLLVTTVFESLKDVFLNPDTYQTVSVSSFTPFIFLSYKADLLLWGLEPLFFYIHQLLALTCVAALIYALGRRWNKLCAIFGASIFLMTGPAFVGANLLMLRHYVEGAIFALAAVLLSVSSGDKYWKFLCASVLYLVACLNKEVYIVLAFIIPFFIPGTFLQRVLKTTPFFVMLAIYTGWRLYILPLREYIYQPGQGFLDFCQKDVLSLLADFFNNIVNFIWGISVSEDQIYWVSGLHLLIFLFLLYHLLFVRKRKSFFFGVLALVGCSILVISPLWGEISTEKEPVTYRLVFHISVIFCIGITYIFSLIAGNNNGATSIFRKRAGFAACILCMLITGLFIQLNWMNLQKTTYKREFLPQSVYNKCYYTLSQDKVLVLPGNVSTSHLSELSRLRQFFEGDSPPSVCKIPFDFRGIPAQYYKYSMKNQILEEITDEFLTERKAFLQKNKTSMPFNVRLQLKNGTMFYHLDADEKTEGAEEFKYFILFGNFHNLYSDKAAVVKSYSISLHKRSVDYFMRFVKQNSEGMIHVSPEWKINFSEESSIDWSSSSDAP